MLNSVIPKATMTIYKRRLFSILTAFFLLWAEFPVMAVRADSSLIYLPTIMNQFTAPSQFVGTVSGTNFFLGLNFDGTEIVAYLCDGAGVASWFRGFAVGNSFDVKDAAGLQLRGVAEAGHVVGTVLIPDQGAFAFDIPLAAVGAGMFRAEMFDGDNKQLLGGWVELSDGQQRGALKFDGIIVSNPPLLATSIGPTRTLDLTNIQLLTPTLSVTGTFTVITASLLTAVSPPPTLNKPFRFVMATMGDSMASGEGNPEVAGDFNDDGDLIQGGSREIWGNTGNFKESCHRSSNAASAQAARLLAAENPLVTVEFRSFACTGAEIANVAQVGADYEPQNADADREHPEQLTQLQIEMLADWLQAYEKLDALYLSIGINDIGFGDILGDCLFGLTTCVGRPTDLSSRISQVQADYVTLRSRLSQLRRAPRQVFVSEYPDPTHNANGNFCTPADFQGDYFARVEEAEFKYTYNSMLIPFNTALAQSVLANGWRMVDNIASGFGPHGVCATDRYINQNRDSLRSQGADYIDLINVSAGISHPNKKGHEFIRDRILDKMRPFFKSSFPAPVAPGNPRILNAFLGANIELGWDDRSNNESRFEVEVTPIDSKGAAQTPLALISIGPDTQRFIKTNSHEGTFDFRVRACSPTNNCSAWTRSVRGSNRVPEAHTNLRQVDFIRPTGSNLQPAIAFEWTNNAHNDAATQVQFRRVSPISAGANLTKTVLIQGRGATRANLGGSGTVAINLNGITRVMTNTNGGGENVPVDSIYAVRVRACGMPNVGCSRWTSVLVAIEGQYAVPSAGLPTPTLSQLFQEQLPAPSIFLRLGDPRNIDICQDPAARCLP